MNIIGLSYDFFISSICLILKNKLVFASPEERLNRSKNSKNFPSQSINLIKKKYNIDLKKIDFFVNSINPGVYFNKFNPIISSQKRHFSEHLISFPDNILKLHSNRDNLISTLTSQEFFFEGNSLKTHFVNHHDAHAANSFYQSEFDLALTFVFDLQGEIASSSVYICQNGNFDKIEQIDYPNSLGLLYASITEYLGFKANSDEWKVMAISNLIKTKKNKYYDIFRKNLINYNKEGHYKVNLDLFNGYYPSKPGLFNNNLIEILGEPINNSHNPTTKQILIAGALQQVLEEVTILKINHYSNKTGIKNICLSGGIFMNCLMNGKLERKFKNLNFYVPFAPDDSGNSIGASLYLKNNIIKNKKKVTNLNNPFLGNFYSNNEILKLLKKYKLKFEKVKKIEQRTAELLYEKKIIGWFQGNSEFGQRALGNRSILANPLMKNVKNILNAVVKYRESFRPFAPAILEERFDDFFLTNSETKVPYMEKIYFLKTKFKKKLKSICHTDGSARVQTVSKSNNKLFYNLIFQFNKISEIPILINTSFNIKGEPIVNSPEDAIKTFHVSGLDCLVIGNYIIKKNEK